MAHLRHGRWDNLHILHKGPIFNSESVAEGPSVPALGAASWLVHPLQQLQLLCLLPLCEDTELEAAVH